MTGRDSLFTLVQRALDFDSDDDSIRDDRDAAIAALEDFAGSAVALLTEDERRWLCAGAAWTNVSGRAIETKLDRLLEVLTGCDRTSECRSSWHLPDCDVGQGAGLGV